MHSGTIYAKTPKGLQKLESRTIHLPRDLGLLFLAVDGKRPVSDLPAKADVDDSGLGRALDQLVAGGYIKVSYEPAQVVPPADDFDLDFTFLAGLGAAR